MTFRIRSECINVDEEEYRTKERLYREHLERVSKNKGSDLWEYFYWDTFHDGSIEKVSFWDTPGNITFHISCPNIKRRKGNSFEYVPSVEFECHFRDVVYFAYEHDTFRRLRIEQYGPSLQYLFSEIDSLIEIIERHNVIDEDPEGLDVFHSLIMEILAGDFSFYIEMVFRQVDVYPKEPVAFELMLASDDFYVPIYREDEHIELPEWISKTKDKPRS